MATTTVASEPELIAEFWNNVFQTELRQNLLFDQYGLKNTHAKGSGVMVHWLSLADLTSTPTALSEGSDPTEHTLSAGDTTANVAQYGSTVKISDILQDTWQAGSFQQLMERLARHAALTIDTVVRNANFTAGGSAQYAGTAVARNSIATSGEFDMDMAEIRESVNSLESLSVPTYPDGFYVGAINEDIKYDLQGDTANWQEILKHTESGMQEIRTGGGGMRPGKGGVVGSMFTVKFIMTQLALLMDGSGSASTDVYQSYIFGPEHYGVSELQNVQTIVKNPSPVSTLDLYGTVGWKVGFATKELESKRMVRIESGASLGD